MPKLENMEMVADTLELRDMLESDEKMDGFYILTNNLYLYGASSIFYSGLMEDFSHFFGISKIYVIPSSINEAILIPDDGTISPTELKETLVLVNDCITNQNERLSDEIYCYCNKTKKLFIV